MVAVPFAERVRTTRALLPLKLSAPPPRAGVLLRQDLQSLVSDVRLHPVTLVTAPAGYGKTTLLSQWLHELNRTGAPTSWLSLDSGDRDPALFLAYLISALQTAHPHLATDAWRILHSASNLERDWPLVAGSLCSDLQRHLPTATFLFLDDAHLVIESAVITQILGYLLRAAPPTLRIILSSRRAPVFAPLGRMRAEGHITEITQQHLHLTSREVEQILAAQRVELSPSALQTLLERTEGWALSVQLAARALAAQPQSRQEQFVQALGGSQEQLLNYLASEVLADLPRDIIDFLRLAAIPNSFDADLLAQVLQSEDVNYLLERSRALGLPILPVDEQGLRMRFHPLWRELLLRGVYRDLDDLGLRMLQRRFGQVFEARGDLEAAIEHYAAARDTADLIRALRERAWPLLQSPRRDLVRRWLEQLPIEMREREPDLLHIWGMSLSGVDAVQSQQVLGRAIDRYEEQGLYERQLRAMGDLCSLLIWRAQPDDGKLARRVIVIANRMRDDWSRGAARVCVAALLYTQWRDVAALRVARQALALPLTSSWRWVLAMVVGSICTRLGRPAEAILAVDEALSLPAIDLDDRLRQNLLRLKGFAQFELGNQNDAIALSLETHQHLSNYDHGGMSAFSGAQLAFLLTLQGRTDEALTYLTQARSSFSSIGVTDSLAYLQVLDVYCLVERGQVLSSGELSSVLRRLQEIPAQRTDLRYWLLLAVAFGESGEEARALSLAQEVVSLMQPRGYRLFLASALLYVAYLAHRAGQKELHASSLHEGWLVAAAEHAHYLIMLPQDVVYQVVGDAIRAGIHHHVIAQVLRRNIPEQSLNLLQELLTYERPEVRATAARLLGDLGAISAYNGLRSAIKDRDAQVRQAAEDALGRLVYRPAYTLRIRTLGAFGLWRGDYEVRDRDWRSSKARQLFQILITERGKNFPRDWVLETLWPDMDHEAAANNLRVTFNRLSKAIEPDRPDGAPSSYILQQADTYTFNLAADYELDSSVFVEAAEAGRNADFVGQRQAAVAAYRRAIGLYNGAYLPDNMYEDWSVVERERLMLLFNEIALRLGSLLLDEGQAHEAIGLAWRALENDPTQEEAYRLLMRSHAYLGERSTALRLYKRCVDVLEQELNVEPLPETVALMMSLRESGEIRPTM